MKRLRPIETVKCCICKEDVDKINTREIFTGRAKYICPRCDALANKEVAMMKSQWKASASGKSAIEKHNRNK